MPIWLHALFSLGGIFDFDLCAEKLTEVSRELEQADVWNDPKKAQELGQERSRLDNIVNSILTIEKALNELTDWIDLYKEHADPDILVTLNDELQQITQLVAKLEFQRMFSGEHAINNAFVDIQSGSGGTEAQDWAQMLLRMYLRWAEAHNFQVSIIEESAGDVAGIKSATIKIEGEYAYGWLRTETGVHRLVRKSPFDANSKRHTSFASVFVYPEIADDIQIDINPEDLRIDTYRASGAGGQHVNKTESAVRITHLPTNTVAQCQNDRSQHKNKAQAMSQLKAKLYELEMLSRNADKQLLEDAKSEIGWGSQIRSYVLDQSRIKDLRTKVENTNTQGVLDGDIDEFIIASLQSGL